MLAQLISTCEVVLFCDSYQILLFFRGKVYHRPTNSGFNFLPTPPITFYYPIWALVDVTAPWEPPITKSSNVWPVQTSSLNPVRWRYWSRHNNAALLGMPLWNMEELMRGYVLACFSALPLVPATSFGGASSLIDLPLCSLPLQRKYNMFRKGLASRIYTSTTADPIQDEEIDAALEVLQMEAVRVAELEAAADCDKGGSGVKAVDGEVQPLPLFGTMDVVFTVLVRNATEEFGFAPSDVYDGVFDLPQTKELHTSKVKELTYSELMTLSSRFSTNRLLDDPSDRVVAVQPCKFLSRRDRWTIGFKSPRIAREVVGSMLSLEHHYLQDTYHLLHNISASSDMTRAIFKAIVHRVLSGNDALQSIAMISDGDTPPTFSTPDTPQSTATGSDGSTPPPHPAPPYKRTKNVIDIDLLRDLRSMTSDSNRYYIPSSGTNPLFDSFTVTFDPSKCAAVVSVFRISTSPIQGGSVDEYPLVRKIIARARELLNCPLEQETHISVKYILVCPEDKLRHQWTMPDGWNENNKHNNQIGDAFCMRVPSHYTTKRPAAD